MVVAAVSAKARQWLGGSLVGAPRPDPQVAELLDELGITSSQLTQIYSRFGKIKKGEPVAMRARPLEVRKTSIAKLVRNNREWVSKILGCVLTLAGCNTIVHWDDFVYALLRFCTLSRLEMCQVMFFVVAVELRTWTLQYVTSAHLEEFYDEFIACPVAAFNTSTIDFGKLPLGKYNMVDFIHLTYQYGQLINPGLYLQRELQRVLPEMGFWRNYDVIKVQNRQIGTDFFRFRKMMSLMDAVRLKQGKAAEEAHMDLKLDLKLAVPPRPKDPNVMPEKGLIPMPSGPVVRRRTRAATEEQLPEWMREHTLQNRDPLRGTALGSAADEARAPDIAPVLPVDWEAVPDPELPKRLYYWNRRTNEVSWQPPPVLQAATIGEAKAAIIQTMGPAKPPPKPGTLGAGLVTRPKGMDDEHKQSALARTKEVDFVRDARKYGASSQPRPGVVGRILRDVFQRFGATSRPP